MPQKASQSNPKNPPLAGAPGQATPQQQQQAGASTKKSNPKRKSDQASNQTAQEGVQNNPLYQGAGNSSKKSSKSKGLL